MSFTARAAVVLFLWVGFATAVQAQLATDATSTQLSTTVASTTPFNPYNHEDVEALVRASFAATPIMIDIARCESGFVQYEDDGNPMYGGTGGMVGVFQEAAAIHNDAAREMGLNLNTLEGNLAYAHYLFDTQGIKPWLASAHCWSPIKSTLQLGSSGKEVTALQQMLNKAGYVVAEDGPGSPGQESATFGPATRAAVKKFQCAVGLVCSGSEKVTGYGMVGQKTRQALLITSAKAPKTASIQR